MDITNALSLQMAIFFQLGCFDRQEVLIFFRPRSMLSAFFAKNSETICFSNGEKVPKWCHQLPKCQRIAEKSKFNEKKTRFRALGVIYLILHQLSLTCTCRSSGDYY